MNFKGYKIHETFQSRLYDLLYSKISEEVWYTAWLRVEDQVWTNCGGATVDDGIYFKLVEYGFDKLKN